MLTNYNFRQTYPLSIMAQLNKMWAA